MHTILALVRAGIGLALVPATAPVLDGVVLRPMAGLDAQPVELVAAWRSSDANPAVHAVRDLVVDVAGHEAATFRRPQV